MSLADELAVVLGEWKYDMEAKHADTLRRAVEALRAADKEIARLRRFVSEQSWQGDMCKPCAEAMLSRPSAAPPKLCDHDPKAWDGEVGEVCDTFTENEHGGPWCVTCDHGAECHERPSAATEETNG